MLRKTNIQYCRWLSRLLLPMTFWGCTGGRAIVVLLLLHTISCDHRSQLRLTTGEPNRFTAEDMHMLTTTTDEMSNCYVVPTGCNLMFSVRRAFHHTSTVSSNMLRVDSLDYNGELGYTVWSSNEKLLKYIDISGNGPEAFVSLATGQEQYGNLIITLHRSGDRLKIPIWAYHIWVPESKVNHYIDGWMDRPLGALVAEKNEIPDADRKERAEDYGVSQKAIDDPCPHGYYLPRKDKKLIGARRIPDYSYITDPHTARQVRCRKNSKLKTPNIHQL